MAKTQPNTSWPAIVEEGTTLYPQLMVSIINGDGTNPVPCTAYAAEQSVADQEANRAKSIGSGSALIACIAFRDSGTGLPFLDFVNTATITEDGKINPGQDIAQNTCIVLWWHIAGDGDVAAATWVGGC